MYCNHPDLRQFIFFQEIFHKNSKIIHLYCFSQYKKYLCKMFSLWTSHFKSARDLYPFIIYLLNYFQGLTHSHIEYP